MSQERDASPQRRPVIPFTRRRLFLSCASHEFGSYRDVLSANLAQPGVELRRQEDFVNAGQTTLEKICEYIRTCDAVIHLIGDATGAYPPPPAVETLLQAFPDFVSRLGLEELIRKPGLSYTQWEAWLGLYFDKKVAVYIATEKTQRDAGFKLDTAQRQRQALHWNCLRSRGRDRREFVTPYELSIEVLRAMPLLVPGFVENVKRGEFRDRNLLFAVLAMQDDILSRETFVRVCRLWADDTSQSIADLMHHEGLLTPKDRTLVEARLDRKLKHRGGDVRQSLAESLGSDARHSLSEALDRETIKSLPDRLAGFSSLQAPSGQWRYKLTRTHGIGGLGVVSVADDASLERSVAVKQLKPERLLDPMAVERFIREARITGRLQHPNIVPVYELGLSPDDQIPFYAMRFVGHRTFHDAITANYSDKAASASDQNLRFRGLLQSFLAVCNAVAFAHEQRVIHRDIKPANIMIGEFGEVILLDWGLARRTDEPEPAALRDAPVKAPTADDATKTLAGVKLGSPAYMAPEQAAGLIDQHGPHTDIYGLGVTLYEVLTGDVPFTGTSTDELLAAIQSREMPNPRERNPAVPPALAAICRKAMEKKPADRYASATRLADDIQHWLADEPVSVFAEPITLRLQRVARKNPGRVSALAATILVGIVGLSSGLYFVNAEKNQKDIALQNESRALGEKGVALVKMKEALNQAEKNADIAAKERQTAEDRRFESEQHLKNTKRTLAQIHFERGLTNEREGQHRTSLTEFFLAATTIPEDGPIQNAYRQVLMDRLTQSGAQSLPPLKHDGPVTSVAFSPDGSRVVTGSRDNSAQLWNAQTGAPLGAAMKHEGMVTNVAFSQDGSRVVTGSWDRTARLWDAQTGAPVGGVMEHEDGLKHVDFNQEGSRVVSVSFDGRARLWDAQTGAPVGAVLNHEGSVHCVAFSPDGSRLVTGSGDGTAHLWDAQAGAPVGALMQHAGSVWNVAFSSDGSRVITGSEDKTARLWNAQTGAPVGAVMKHESDVNTGVFSIVHAAFSPDGSHVVTGSGDGTARLWNAQTGAPVGAVMQHQGSVQSVAFSPDGGRVVTGSWDNSAQLWDAQSGTPLGDVMKHDIYFDQVGSGIRMSAFSPTFSPDGTRVVTGSGYNTARLWDAQTGAPVLVMTHDDVVKNVAFSPDGMRLITGSEDNSARLWDVQTGTPVGALMKHDSSVENVAISPDGTRVVTGSEDKTARLWNAQTGAPVGAVMNHEGSVQSIAFSPDGSRLVTGSRDKTARLWNAQTGAPVGAAMNQEGSVQSVAFSPDGSRLVTGSEGAAARLWNAQTGAPVGAVMNHEGSVRSVAFSPDGSRVVTGSDDKTARLWSAQTGAPVGAVMNHGDIVMSVAFSPDGSRVVTACWDKTARLWDAQTGASVGAVMQHSDSIIRAAFSPDGSRVVTVSRDMTARIWDAQSGAPAGAVMKHDWWVSSVAFSPDSSRLVTGSGDGKTARLWDTRTGAPVGAAMNHRRSVWGVAFSPDGSSVVTGSGDGAARLWDAGTPNLVAVSREQLRSIFEVWSGIHVTDDGTPHDILAIEFVALRQKLGDRDPLFFFQREHYARLALGRAVYAAQSAEDERNWFAAAFHLRRLIQFYSELANADSPDVQTQLDLISSYARLGEAQIHGGEYPQGVENFQQGLGVLEMMIAKKQFVEYAASESEQFQQRIQYCESAAIATGEWETLLKTDANVLPELLRIRATELAKRRRIADVAQAAAKLREIEPGTNRELYNAACAYGLCANAVKDNSPSSEAQETEHKKFVDLSLACLKEAIAAGYDNFDHMWQDTDLSSLRDLPEFESLFPDDEKYKVRGSRVF